jgi:hypothetical protein
MVVCPDARVLVVLLPMATLFVPEYTMPFTVTLHAFDAVEMISPAEPDISCRFQLRVVVLLAVLWLTCTQLNFSVSYAVTATLVLPLEAILVTYLY